MVSCAYSIHTIKENYLASIVCLVWTIALYALHFWTIFYNKIYLKNLTVIYYVFDIHNIADSCKMRHRSNFTGKKLDAR